MAFASSFVHAQAQLAKIKTPKGRIYPKFVRNSDKSYFFSEKQAKQAGFVHDPDCKSSGNLDGIEDVE